MPKVQTKNNEKPRKKKTPTQAVQEMIKLKTRNPKLSCQEIGDIVGRDKSNVSRALRRYGFEMKGLGRYKDNRADILAGFQNRILEAIDSNKLDKASLKDIALSYGILYDKERLERGKSTENVAMSGLVEIIDKQVREKIEDHKV